jgi:UDP-N-acetylmuramoyl-tripeptide--D-alanyl-D-alanine ligase
LRGCNGQKWFNLQMTTTGELYDLFTRHPFISTDTRKILPDSLFFALKGDKFNANTFAEQAIASGAAYAIIDESGFRLNDSYIVVDDVLTALQNLARWHRRLLGIPVIGLTGSNGKTTTKELITSVLSQRYRIQSTVGNLNNHIGVPLTILTIDGSHEMAVVEMGANHQKEIKFLCTIAQPTHGLITNVGKAHLEGFGGIEGVKKGKGELYDYLKNPIAIGSISPKVGNPIAIGSESPDQIGVAFIDSGNTILIGMEKERHLANVIYYGSGAGDNLVTGKLLENAPFLSLQWTNNKTGKHSVVNTQLTGAYNLNNILAAICIGVYFGLNDENINMGIETYQPKNNRSQIVRTATNTLICDYYNANPSSMFVAIENMDKITADRKILILGDMFEMGAASLAEHEAVIQKAMETNVDERIFIGKDFYEGGKSIVHSPSSMEKKNSFYETTDDAIMALKDSPVINSTILIKGSRGMALERLVELF